MHPTEHSSTEAHGFTVTDATHHTRAFVQGELVWVGTVDGGRWLHPAQAVEVASAISRAANAAISRQAGSAA